MIIIFILKIGFLFNININIDILLAMIAIWLTKKLNIDLNKVTIYLDILYWVILNTYLID